MVDNIFRDSSSFRERIGTIRKFCDKERKSGFPLAFRSIIRTFVRILLHKQEIFSEKKFRIKALD